VRLKNINKYMIYKNIKYEVDYIIWLKERIKKLRFGVNNKVKTDSSIDFEMLARKLKSYEQEYSSLVDDLYSLLKGYDVSRKTDNFRQSS